MARENQKLAVAWLRRRSLGRLMARVQRERDELRRAQRERDELRCANVQLADALKEAKRDARMFALLLENPVVDHVVEVAATDPAAMSATEELTAEAPSTKDSAADGTAVDDLAGEENAVEMLAEATAAEKPAAEELSTKEPTAVESASETLAAEETPTEVELATEQLTDVVGPTSTDAARIRKKKVPPLNSIDLEIQRMEEGRRRLKQAMKRNSYNVARMLVHARTAGA